MGYKADPERELRDLGAAVLRGLARQEKWAAERLASKIKPPKLPDVKFQPNATVADRPR